MRNNQSGFIIPLIFSVVAVLFAGGAMYSYSQNKTANNTNFSKDIPSAISEETNVLQNPEEEDNKSISQNDVQFKAQKQDIVSSANTESGVQVENNTKSHHEKVYIVETKNRLSNNFEMLMHRGVVIQDDEGKKYKTKPCKVQILGDKKFSITLTEGKKRQIRRMCEVCHAEVTDLERVRIMNIELGYLSDNNIRKIKGEELEKFLKDLGVMNPLRSGGSK